MQRLQKSQEETSSMKNDRAKCVALGGQMSKLATLPGYIDFQVGIKMYH